MAASSFAFIDQPAWSFGRRSKGRSAEATPGPGAYDVGPPLLSVRDTITMRRNGPTKQRTMTKRKTTEYLFNGPNETPGPGEYDIPSIFGNLPPRGQWVNLRRSQPRMPGRSSTTDDVPGPGSYVGLDENFYTNYNAKGPSFGGRTKRPSSASHRQPYEPPSASMDSPGPGEYYSPLTTPRADQGSAWAASGTPRLGAQQAWGPGPGAYEPRPMVHGQAPVFKGASQRQYDAQGRLGDGGGFPGPGAYGSPSHESFPSGPKYSFRPRPAHQSTSEAPGPGTYELAGRPSGPHYSLGSRIKAEDHPLPTDFLYDASRNRAGMSTVMGRHEFAHYSDNNNNR